MPIPLDDDFPRQYALTGAFRYGWPRNFEIGDDAITFLRAANGFEAKLGLWRYDLATGVESPLVLPDTLTVDDADLPAAERARRERLRESGAGITAFSMSRAGQQIVFAVGGVLWVWNAGTLTSIETPGSVVDPRIDNSGTRIACVIDGATYLYDIDGRELGRIARDGRTVGLVDFIAAEELGRYRGHWWSPAGDAIVVEVVDESAVPTWLIADPTYPDRPATPHRYPHAGATNPSVSLVVHHVDSGTDIDVRFDAATYEYLVAVHWSEHGAPLVQLANREQTTFTTFALDINTGVLSEFERIHGEPWLDVVPGTPAWLPGQKLLSFMNDHDSDSRRITIDGTAVTPVGFHVLAVVNAGATPVVHGTADGMTATAIRINADQSITALDEPNAWQAYASNGKTTLRSRHDSDSSAVAIEVLRDRDVVGTIENNAECAAMPAPTYVRLGSRAFNATIVWPEQPVTEPLPIVMSPYGGPHHSRVLKSGGLFAVEQWLANQGFAVIVADGRGTPGRGLAWEHAIAHKFAAVTLADQVDALDAALAMFPDRLDGTRVGIRGWSYGGYLSALALLARPDRFHVGIAGAPVTDWRLYDTAYTERYLGHPHVNTAVYDENSLLSLAPNLQGKLLIVHGLADDNVVAAHSLQLSAALLAAGKLHDFIPLAGVSHMTPQVTVKENLLRMEAEYLRQHLSR